MSARSDILGWSRFTVRCSGAVSFRCLVFSCDFVSLSGVLVRLRSAVGCSRAVSFRCRVSPSASAIECSLAASCMWRMPTSNAGFFFVISSSKKPHWEIHWISKILNVQCQQFS